MAICDGNCKYHKFCWLLNEEVVVRGEECEHYEPDRPIGECKTCKHFVKGGLDGKTYVCEHPSIELDDYFDYACLAMEENDFCSCYEKKEGGEK